MNAIGVAGAGTVIGAFNKCDGDFVSGLADPISGFNTAGFGIACGGDNGEGIGSVGFGGSGSTCGIGSVTTGKSGT